jgi:ribonucleoside-diphosphate reductase alpha chain
MIYLSKDSLSIEEIRKDPRPPAEKPAEVGKEEPLAKQAIKEEITLRPDVVDARVYRLRSGFVKQNVYITLSWIVQEDRKRPIEIFFNSKDLTRSPEYAILTRLISAIFRKSSDPSFILEELRGIHDPSGGVFKNGRYLHSFYAEVADVIETFFYDVGILHQTGSRFPSEKKSAGSVTIPVEKISNSPANEVVNLAVAQINEQFKICPDCQERSLKMENGCDSCMSCGYSKCDK